MNANKKDYIITAILVLITVIIIIVVNVFQQKMPDHLIAKVRYFDGSLDTLQIKSYKTIGDSILIITDDGRQMVTGSNNVIIVEDEGY